MAQTRPLRRPASSSPLAGPSISGDGTVVSERNYKDRPQPSRIKSTPDLKAAARKFPARTSSLRSTHGRQRALLAKHYSSSSRPSTAPTSSAPTRPPRSILRESRQQTSTLPSSRSPPNFMPAAYHQNNRSVPSIPSDWLTSNTYIEVPRFSRVGLASTDVVLPLLAKRHKRHSSLTAQSPRISSRGSQHARMQSMGEAVKSALVGILPKAAFEEDGGESKADEELNTEHPDFRASFLSSFHDDFRLSIKPQMEAFPLPLRILRQEDSVINRQSLYSIPGSPGSFEMEFSMLAEEGDDQDIIMLFPYSEKTFPSARKGVQPIVIPSVPIDVDLETPLSPNYPNRMSVRRFSTRSRTHSCGSLVSKRKPSLKQRKSLASLKAHKRAISKADSVLTPTNPFEPKGLRKTASFISLGSSDELELEEGTGRDVTDIEEVSDEDNYVGTSRLSRKRSIDTFSIESEDLREAEQLLMDILALPTYGVKRATSSGIPPLLPHHIPSLARSRPQSRSFGPASTIPAPTSDLPPVPSSRPASPQYRGFEFPAVPSPSMVRTRASEVILQRADSPPVSPTTLVDAPPHLDLGSNLTQPSKVLDLERISTGRQVTTGSYHDLCGLPADKLAQIISRGDLDDETSSLGSGVTLKAPYSFKAREIIGMDESDVASVSSGTTSRASHDTAHSGSLRPPASRGNPAKAMSLLGIEDDDGPSTRRRQFSSAKALERLGLYGDHGSYPNNGSSSVRLTPFTEKGKNDGVRKQGGVKKLWKTLTKGSVRGGSLPLKV